MKWIKTEKTPSETSSNATFNFRPSILHQYVRAMRFRNLNDSPSSSGSNTVVHHDGPGQILEIKMRMFHQDRLHIGEICLSPSYR